MDANIPINPRSIPISNKIIKLGFKPMKDYLMAMALKGLDLDTIEIHYLDRHSGDFKYMMELINRSFGKSWVITKEETILVHNPRCKWEDDNHKCTNPAIMFPGKCTETVKGQCKGYERKFTAPMRVNRVVLDKVREV